MGNIQGRVFLPKVPFIALESDKNPYPFKRTQFPIRLSFSMSINKAESKHWTLWAYTFAVFSHGQLYVALSRARTADCIKILIKRDVDDCSGFVFTKNVVYD